MGGNVQMNKVKLIAKIMDKDNELTLKKNLLVTILESIRIMHVIIAYHDYKIWKINVKNTLLNRKFHGELYITQFEGFE